MLSLAERIKGGILGHCVGDALGVPVEFCSREELKESPITTMIGWGTYDQPPGTWSDDSSLMLCTIEAFTEGFSLRKLAEKFVKWLNEGYWTPHGEVFDVGSTTKEAIKNLEKLLNNPESDLTQAGLTDEYSCGNGSLMRILPVALYTFRWNPEKRLKLTRDISSLTHGHPRCQIACGIFVELVSEILRGKERITAYQNAVETIKSFYSSNSTFQEELETHFKRITTGEILKARESDINSSGYVIHTLEASLWAFYTSNTFQEAVLRAVNLGKDTDTTGAVTGGLAGVYHGYSSIPQGWLKKLLCLEEIEELSENLLQKFGGELAY